MLSFYSADPNMFIQVCKLRMNKRPTCTASVFIYFKIPVELIIKVL